MGTEKRRGRRPRSMGDTRGSILRAAIHQFAESGLQQTSLRSIAREAGVDPALILHYFGSKRGLFLALVRQKLDEVLAGLLGDVPPTKDIGDLLVARFLALWDGDRRLFAALFRTAMFDENLASLLRTELLAELVRRVAATHSTEAERRAALALSQLMGMAVGRYVLGIEPLASADPEEVAADMGPTLTRYLLRPLPPPARPGGR